MEKVRVFEKTGKDGTLNLRIPLGKPEIEFEVVVIVQPKATASVTCTPGDRAWPPGYFDLAGSITDETFFRDPERPPGAA
jgi:hypothetical protein